jgi:hypothetical protein
MKLLRVFHRGGGDSVDKSVKSNHKRRERKKDEESSSKPKTASNGFQVTGNDTDTVYSQTSKLSTDEELSGLSIPHDAMASTHAFSRQLDAFFRNKYNKSVLLGEHQVDVINRCIAFDYTEILLQRELEDMHGVEKHFLCASHIMDQFWDKQILILETKFPTTAQEIIFLEIEEYVLPRVLDQLYPLQDLSPEITAKAVLWIYQLECDLKRWAPELRLQSQWFEERKRLFEHYLDTAVRHKMTIQLMEVLKLHSDDDIRRDIDGKLVTGLPEQVTYIVNQQLKAASESLPKEYKEDVLLACNAQVSNMISDWSFRILSEWSTMGSAFFCSIINDTSRLNEYCEERHEELLTSSEAIEKADVLTNDIGELSLHATRYLGERIMNDLCQHEEILVLVGTSGWENPEEFSPVERTIATFKDFLVDIEEWLDQEYFYAKLSKQCLDLALQTYLEFFFANTMTHGLKDPAVAANELRHDYLRFVNYFNGDDFTDYHGRCGFYSQKAINDRWRILQHMADCIDPTNCPQDLLFEVQELVSNFGDNGGPVVLHLAGLRKRQKASNTIVWLQQIAAAKKHRARDCGTDVSPPLVCRLPDMRNSRMLHNLRRVPQEKLSRQLSEGTRPFAQSTARLLGSNESSISVQLMEWQHTAVDKWEFLSSIPSPRITNFYDSKNRDAEDDRHDTDSMERASFTMAEI